MTKLGEILVFCEALEQTRVKLYKKFAASAKGIEETSVIVKKNGTSLKHISESILSQI